MLDEIIYFSRRGCVEWVCQGLILVKNREVLDAKQIIMIMVQSLEEEFREARQVFVFGWDWLLLGKG